MSANAFNADEFYNAVRQQHEEEARVQREQQERMRGEIDRLYASSARGAQSISLNVDWNEAAQQIRRDEDDRLINEITTDIPRYPSDRDIEMMRQTVDAAFATPIKKKKRDIWDERVARMCEGCKPKKKKRKLIDWPSAIPVNWDKI
jgi:hypothetical protein